MAIGQATIQATPIQSQRPNVSSASFGTGVATALEGIAKATGRYEDSLVTLANAEDERRSRAEGFDADRRWAELQGGWRRSQLDNLNNAPETGDGITNARYDQLAQEREEFLASLPESQRERFSGPTETAVQNLTTNMYQSEFQLRNNYENNQVQQSVSAMSTDLVQGNAEFEGAFNTVATLINSSSLSEAEKTAALEAAEADLRAAEFHSVLNNAQAQTGPSGNWQDKEVVAAGLTPQERGILNVIAKEESAGQYNVRWNGPGGAPAYFDDFSDHPRIFVDNGHGDVSSAAGRYQFVATTWDSLPERFRRGGFTPENQDRAALYLAERDYNRQIGAGEPSFRDIINNGSDAQLLTLRDTLATTWAAFHTMSDNTFINTFRGSQGVAGGGTGTAAVPDVWNDPQYDNVPFALRMQMASDASSTQAAINDQEAQARQTNADLLKAALAAGEPNAREGIEQAVSEGNVPLDQMDDLLKLTSDDREAEQGGQRFSENVSNGIRMGNTPDNQADAQRFYQDSGIYAGLQQSNPQAAALLGQTFAQSGVMPPEVASLLLSQSQSADPRQVQYAMTALAEMRNRSPFAFGSAMPKELVVASAAWELATRYNQSGDASGVSEQFQIWGSPEQLAMLEQYEAEPEEILLDISNDELLDGFRTFADRWGLRMHQDNNMTLPQSPQALAQFRQDADGLFTQYYPLFQDKDQTIEFVTQQMSHSWSEDATGGQPQLMFLAPTSPAAGYETLNNSTDWVRDDILASQGWTSDTQFGLVSDKQSEGDVARGEPASYTIIQTQDDGTQRLVIDETTGLPTRFRPTISNELRQGAFVEAQAANVAAQAESVDAQIYQLEQQVGPRTMATPAQQELAQEQLNGLYTQREQLNGQTQELTAQSLEGRSVAELRDELAEIEASKPTGLAVDRRTGTVGEAQETLRPAVTIARDAREAAIRRQLELLGETE